MESLSITEPSEGLSHKLTVLGDTPSFDHFENEDDQLSRRTYEWSSGKVIMQ
jgi:hypothetical protein